MQSLSKSRTNLAHRLQYYDNKAPDIETEMSFFNLQ